MLESQGKDNNTEEIEMIVKTREMQDRTQVIADGNVIGSVRPTGTREDGATVFLVNVYSRRTRFEIAGDRDYAIAVLADRHMKR